MVRHFIKMDHQRAVIGLLLRIIQHALDIGLYALHQQNHILDVLFITQCQI